MNKLKQYLNILFGIPLCLLGAALLYLILFSEDETSSLIVITIASICLIPGIYLLANTKYFSQLSKQAEQHKQEADEYYQQKKQKQTSIIRIEPERPPCVWKMNRAT